VNENTRRGMACHEWHGFRKFIMFSRRMLLLSLIKLNNKPFTLNQFNKRSSLYIYLSAERHEIHSRSITTLSCHLRISSLCTAFLKSPFPYSHSLLQPITFSLAAFQLRLQATNENEISTNQQCIKSFQAPGIL